MRRTIRSALLWTSSLRILTRVLAVGSTLVVARTIAPEEYGVFATILIAGQALTAISAVSVTASITQMARDPLPYLDTAWTVEVIRGAVLCVLTILLAPVWCDLFRVPEAVPLLRTLALVYLIVGFHNVGIEILRREMRFGRIFALHATEAITYSIVVIAASLLLQNAWALVVGTLISFSARVAASYALTPVRARLSLDPARFGEMFRFTRWTNAYQVVDFVVETIDNVVVARVVSATALGFYRMAYQLATEGSSALQWVVTSVAFPAVARLQFDREHVRRSFRAVLGLMAATLVPATILLVVIGPIVVPLALGVRWTPMAVPLQILAVAALLRGLFETARPVLLGVGNSRADFQLKVFQALTLVAVAIPAGIAYGMEGVAWGVLGAAVLSLPAWLYAVSREARLGLCDVLEPILAPFVAAITGIAALALVPWPEATWWSVILHTGLFAAVYAGSSAVLYVRLPRSGLAAAAGAIR